MKTLDVHISGLKNNFSNLLDNSNKPHYYLTHSHLAYITN